MNGQIHPDLQLELGKPQLKFLEAGREMHN